MSARAKRFARAHPPRVALIVETSGVYGRKILSGISSYLRCHRRWSVYLEQRELGSQPPAWLLKKKWDGIVSRPTDPKLAAVFRKTKVPVVDLNDLHEDLGLPRVGSDHHEVGRAAARHLQDKSLRFFAFCGFSGEAWSEKRRDGFSCAAAESGNPVAVFEGPWRAAGNTGGNADLNRIARWLSGLPKPVGVMACNDVRGLDVVNACERAGLLVPEDIAVIGVDNEQIHCDFCDPPLSSVEPDSENIGYRAAEMLDTLMHGETPDEACVLMPPLRIVSRPSTDSLAVEDELVKRTVRYIREHALQGCTVQGIASHLRVSRSTLERRCRESLNRSPQEEIRRTRLDEIRKLLTETNFTLEHIAELCGFEHPEYMCVFFKRLTGRTPGGFRKHFHQLRSIGGL